jgi:hypothetical protein
VAVKVLAWPPTGPSELAALIAMAPTVSAEFSCPHRDVKGRRSRPPEAVRTDPPISQDRLVTYGPSTTQHRQHALEDTIAWLSKVASTSLRIFGQALSQDRSIPVSWTARRFAPRS